MRTVTRIRTITALGVLGVGIAALTVAFVLAQQGDDEHADGGSDLLRRERQDRFVVSRR